jgi:hypothetical protein
VAKTETAIEKRIRERSEELRSVLIARRGDLAKMQEGTAAFRAAGIEDSTIDRLLTAMQQSVDVILKAVVSPPPPPSPKT